MTSYRVKPGTTVALASLVVLDPQPDPGSGIRVTRRTYGGDNTVVDQGRYFEFKWSVYDTAASYLTLLGLFGLSASIDSALVTVYIRNEAYTWSHVNGTAIRPIPGKTVKWGDKQSRPLDISILVKNLSSEIPPP